MPTTLIKERGGNMPGTIRMPGKSRRTIIVKEDPQELEFERYLKLWLDDEITYDDMLDKYPDTDSSMIRKVLKRLNVKSGSALT